MLRKTTLKLSVSLFTDSILSIILSGLIILMLSTLLKRYAACVVISVICFIIFILLIYNTAWHEGLRDPNRIKCGHMRKFIWKGLVSGFLASVPFAVIYILFLISSITGINKTLFTVIFRLIYMPYALLSPVPFSRPAVCAVFLIPLPVIAFAAYVLGFKQIYVMDRIIYKNDKKRGRQGP